VIPILSAHLRAESIVVYHPHHHPVSFVLLVVVESIVVLVIPVRRVPAVTPVTTVVPEKNAMKSVNSLAVVVKEVRVVKVARVATTVVALLTTTLVHSLVTVGTEGKEEKVERVARVATTVDTKVVNSSVKLFTNEILLSSVVYVFHSCGNKHCFITTLGTRCHSTHPMNEHERFLQQTSIFIASASVDIRITSTVYINFPHDALCMLPGGCLVSLFISCIRFVTWLGCLFYKRMHCLPNLFVSPYANIYVYICCDCVPTKIVK